MNKNTIKLPSIDKNLNDVNKFSNSASNSPISSNVNNLPSIINKKLDESLYEQRTKYMTK